MLTTDTIKNLRIATHRAAFLARLSRVSANPDARARVDKIWRKQLDVVHGLVARLRLN